MSMWSLKMLQYINCRLRVTTQGGHQLIGKLLAVLRNFNLVLGDCEEFRTLPPTEGSQEEREVRRTIGLVLLRRGQVFSLIVEGPPPPDDNRLGTTAIPGPGLGSAAGRCVATSQLALAQPGLVGGPSRGMMQPPSPMMRGGPPRPGMPGPPRQQPPRPGMMPPPRQGMPPPPRQGMPHPPPGMRQGQDCQV